MGHTVHHDGVQARVAGQDLHEAPSSRITLPYDFYIPAERIAQRTPSLSTVEVGDHPQTCQQSKERSCSPLPALAMLHDDPLLSLIHISEPTRLRRISYAVFCL